MAEAYAENFLLHGVQFLEEIEELAGPQIIAMRVVADPGDGKAIVGFDLVIVGEISCGYSKTS